MDDCFHVRGVLGQCETAASRKDSFPICMTLKARRVKISPQLLTAATREGTNVIACLFRKVGAETRDMEQNDAGREQSGHADGEARIDTAIVTEK